jgi:integrase
MADQATAPTPALSAATDYLGLPAEERYAVMSQRFPSWLHEEPITFPAHHRTYGWACRVSQCQATPNVSNTSLLCVQHSREFSQVQNDLSIDEFVTSASPLTTQSLGRCLFRGADCKICGGNREASQHGYCTAHAGGFRSAQRKGISESAWRRSQRPLPPFPSCVIPRCVHDGELRVVVATERNTLDAQSREGPLCRLHRQNLRFSMTGRQIDRAVWHEWFTAACTGELLTHRNIRGELRLADLPVRLQREVRYGLHRHATTARRTMWRPTALQKVVDALATAGVESLCDPRVVDLGSDTSRGSCERRIWLDLPFAARSLSLNAEMAKAEGWFDPVIVGGGHFTSSQSRGTRRKIWTLNSVSQRWLRDLVWDDIHDESLRPTGKRPSIQTIYKRIGGAIMLSHILRQNRADRGEEPALLGAADAKTVKDTWDLWYREQIVPPIESAEMAKLGKLTETTRSVYMSGVRIVLLHGRQKQRTDPSLDSFIFGLPEYSMPPKRPRPRPLSFADFQLLVSEKSLRVLDAADREGVGWSDIWLTQAFQGGRISETLKLRLGCVGLVGTAQPYFWRDISKANVVDHGMPCHLPVYERLLRRQSITRAKLRARYADELVALDERGRARLEAEWERTMPLFPSSMLNPDLAFEVSYSSFLDRWTGWFESLGLSGITTHQTRATLATSLLNNGAPAALVRQLLGHFSDEALAHYARYCDDTMIRHLQQVWAAGPGTDKPGSILLRPTELETSDATAAAARIDLTVVPVEHGLCRYGPVVGGSNCPFEKNCTNGPKGPCEHFVLTGADLAYWERKRDAAVHFAEGAPSDAARDYILGAWHPWEPVLTALREALDELGLLEEAEKLDLRAPVHDYFNPLFSKGWTLAALDVSDQQPSADPANGRTQPGS